MNNAVFDPVRFESHARVRAEALRFAEGLVAAARQRMSPTEGPLVSTAALKELVEDNFVEGEPREVARGRTRIAGACLVLIDLVLQHPNFAAFRSLRRCKKKECQRWFLAVDDARRRYCGPNCWPSNQPHARTVRSWQLRRRVLASRCNG